MHVYLGKRSLSAPDAHGATPLHSAAAAAAVTNTSTSKNGADVAKLLLQRGAPPGALDSR